MRGWYPCRNNFLVLRIFESTSIYTRFLVTFAIVSQITFVNNRSMLESYASRSN